MSSVEKLNNLAVMVHRDNYIVILAGAMDKEELWEYKCNIEDKNDGVLASVYQHKFARDISLTILCGNNENNYIYNLI